MPLRLHSITRTPTLCVNHTLYVINHNTRQVGVSLFRDVTLTLWGCL